jgi:hypothetical protein
MTYFHKFLRPGGQIGIVVPGLARDIKGTVPEHLTRPRKGGGGLWVDECWCFHTAAWWRRHWGKMSVIKDVAAEVQPDGVKDWLQYEKACREAGTLMFPSEEETLEADAGRYLAIIRVLGRRK